MEPDQLHAFLKDRYHYKIKQSMSVVMDYLEDWILEGTLPVAESERLEKAIKNVFSYIDTHIRKKETVFYPYISQLVKNGSTGKTVDGVEDYHFLNKPIQTLRTEQRYIQKQLLEIKMVTSLIDTDKCSSTACIMCMTALFEIENETGKQFHIEQTILFPKLMGFKVV